MVRVVVTGGGTGGHVYPSIAVACRLLEAHPDAAILFVGSAAGPESEAARRSGIRFEGIPLKGLVGKRPRDRLQALVLFVRGLLRCRRLLHEFKATCVVGTGGFAAAPACVAALILRIPLVLHELNYHPGLVTRLLARRAYAVACAYPETAGLLPAGTHTVVTGVAVRPEIEKLRQDEGFRRAARERAQGEFGLQTGRSTLLVFGGSQGAEAMNKAVWEMVPELRRRSDLQVIHVTGRRDYSDPKLDAVLHECRDEGEELTYRAIPYTENIYMLYAAADLAVTRAGAGTIAELSVAGVPAVLVPFPYATEGHQESNAEEAARAGWAEVVKQDGPSAIRGLERALELVDDPEALDRMRAAAAGTASPPSAKGIVALVEELTGRGRPGRC